jgi:GDP-L-fucose synthase
MEGKLETPFQMENTKVWIAGHRGLVGGAIAKRLSRENCTIVTIDRDELDLRDQVGVKKWLEKEKPSIIILAAAKVGGIVANSTQPADFLYDNLVIETNIIKAAHEIEVKKLLFLGSSCIYPRDAKQPMVEEELLTGPLEKTNESYAIAKIAGLKMCEAFRTQYGCDFISAQPTNLYGEGDKFDPEMGHVIPALMVKAHKGKLNNSPKLNVWGSGTPQREFLYIHDLADALVHLLKNYSGKSHINIGTGEEFSIKQLAEKICDVVGFQGELVFDTTKPDGSPRKLVNNSRLAELGWKSKTSLDEGLAKTYKWYLDNVS